MRAAGYVVLLAGVFLASWGVSGPAAAAARRLTINPALSTDLIGGAADFSAQVQGRTLAGNVNAVFVMPGETLRIAAMDRPPAADIHLATQGLGQAPRRVDGQWRWRVPAQPGLYPIRLVNRATGGEMRLNVFVKTPFNPARDTLNGYDIGRYEPVARANDPHSGPPRALIEVTEDTTAVHVSPHFTLGDFLCHQQPAHWPKYLLIRPALLRKLEHIRRALIEAGIDGESLVVMSGYRTPWYNADIGNTTVYSQHLFGSAADIFVDADGDDEMDDLDADGVISIADADWLADLVETVTATEPALAGGLSAYPGNAFHGPFVHVDVRGIAVRW